MNGNDTFLDINNAHLRVNNGNVQASTFVLDQIDFMVSSNASATVRFNNPTTAFLTASNIEVGTANLFVDTSTSNVGVGTDVPLHTLDVRGDMSVSSNLEVGSANLFIDTSTSNVGIGTNIPMDALHINGGTLIGGHVLPTQHQQFDIGSAERKIRHLFLSDNSLWLGDETRITFSGGKMKFRRRKKNILPRGLRNIGIAAGHANETDTRTAALAHAGKTDITQMKLEHWVNYAKTLDATKDISDVFTDEADDYEATTASEAFKEIGDDIFSSHNVAIGKSTAPTSALDVVGTVKATAFEGDGSALTGITSGQWTESSGNIYRSSGNVGIGGTNPSVAKLHIGPFDNDHLYLASANDAYGWKLDTGDQGNGAVPFRIKKRTDGADTTVLTIKNEDGFVGIGTTIPKSAFHVSGDSTRLAIADNTENDCDVNGFNVALAFVDNTWNGSSLYSQNPAAGMGFYLGHVSSSNKEINMRNLTGELSFGTRDTGARAMIINNNGLVGIGTSSAQQNLHVHESGSGQVVIAVTNDTTGGGNNDGIHFGIDSSEQGFVWHKQNTSLLFATNNTERMRIANGGWVGVGTTGPCGKFHVWTGSGDSNSTGNALIIGGHTNCSGNTNLRIGCHNDYAWIQSHCSEPLCLNPGGNNVGVNTTNPHSGLHAYVQYSIFGKTNTGSGLICDDIGYAKWRQTCGSYHLTFQRHNNSSSTNYTSWSSRGYLHKDNGNTIMNFTGQHRTFIGDVPFTQAESKEGLIVSANSDTYIKMSDGIAYGANAITINECLPVVTLSKTSNDKACFGVISLSEDPETREDAFGTFVSVMEKEKGDTRVYINSVGEGGIWITNKNGTLESGDYVTTSTIPGYGVKQEDDILHNYTVAKITMNCNFNPTLQKVKRIKKKLTDVKYWVYVSNVTVTKEEYDNLQPEFRRIIQDEDGNDIYQTNDRTEWTHNPVEEDGIIPFTETRNELQNDLDEHGQIQWEDTDDFEKAYKIRYILADATQISESEYDAKIAAGEEAYKAAFVGCTYHCG